MRFTLADLSTGGQDVKFPVQIVCPHCGEAQELPKKRSQAIMSCKKCKKEFQQPVPNEPALAEPPMGPLDSARFEKGRNFANKVWNAARYVLTSIDASGAAAKAPGAEAHAQLMASLRAEDRWILSRMNSTIGAVSKALDDFEFSRAIGALYDFFWNEFCSWYIELSKSRLTPASAESDRVTASAVLLYVLDRSLRLLHPFCPYVSEALWTELGKRADARTRNLGRNEYRVNQNRLQERGQLIAAPWPEPEAELVDAGREAQFASVFETVVAIRAVRQQLIDNAPKERKKDVGAAVATAFTVAIRTQDPALAQRLNEQAHILINMAEIETPAIGAEIPAVKPASATAIKGGMVYVALPAGLVDVEMLRLDKEIKQTEQYIPKIEVKLKNENFVRNAPPELVDAERAKLEESRRKLVTLKAALADLSA
jgi:valyl-tRNA synthetase